jgi:hypothetical protein
MNKELATVSNETSPLTAIDIRKQVNLIQSVMKEVMRENEHYGKVPGCGNKPTLLKSGAEKIAMTFKLGSEFEELPGSIESDSLVCYKINCKLFHIPTGNLVGNGRGACNSKEKKYSTRSVYANKANDEEKAIGKLETRVTNDNKKYEVYIVPQNPWDVQNTIYKMACKRAMVAAILNATAASDIFTQDIEDLPEEMQQEIASAETAAQSTKPAVDMPKAKSETAEKKPQGENPNTALVCSCGAVMTETVFNYSKDKYGKPLCFSCQKLVNK